MPYIEDRSTRILLFECLGTLIFTYGVGCATLASDDIVVPADGVLVACSLLAGLALCAQITDGHLNPLLSVAAHVKRPSSLTGTYILGQFIGGLLGVLLFWLITDKLIIPVVDDPINGNGVEGFKEILKYILNEIIGSFFFAIMVLVVTNHLTSFATKSWQMYLAVISSLFLVRKMTGQTALNPAIAVPAQLFSAIIDPTHANGVKSIIVLIPALIGGAIAGMVMSHVYQPMLLYKNFKEQLQYQQSHQSQQIQQNQKRNSQQ